MAAPDPVIVSVGMLTAVGLTAPETAAAVRSGVMRFAETSIMDRSFQPFTLAEVPEEGLPDLAEPLQQPGLTSREARMLRLAAMPLQECAAVLSDVQRPLPLLLALPENETTRPLDPARFLDALRVQVPGLIDARRSTAAFRGRAGGLQAIGHAADAIRAGQAEFIIAGGVDTYRDLYVLGTLDLETRVKTERNLDGFIPGEGAAFVLVASRAAAQAAQYPPLASMGVWARATETGHLYSEEPYQGNGLATAVQQLVSAGGAYLPVSEVYSSMNGEAHWAKEWGVAYLRSKTAFAEPHGMHHPADCYGDTGAAAAPLMVGLAALGISGGYRQPAALVYGSSDRGDRAAALVTA